MTTLSRLTSAIALSAALLMPNVHAGSTQNGEPSFPAEQVIPFAKKVERELASRGAHVAIIARAGQSRDKLPEGIKYTHTALAVYSQITTKDGRKIPGYAIYNLYQRAEEKDVSDLIVDYPAEFFASAKVLEAGIVIPSPELQKRLLQVIASPTYAKLHVPQYSLIANPYTTEFQNCTEHTLDVITAAIYQTDDVATIKARLREYFQAQPVKVNPIKLSLGGMFMDGVTKSDHPGKVETATFTTISQFLQQNNATSAVLTITPDA